MQNKNKKIQNKNKYKTKIQKKNKYKIKIQTIKDF